MKKIALSLVIPFLINAADVNQNELVSFSAQKYKVDYNTQTQENKDKLKKEYENTIKLFNLIASDIKNDVDYKIAKSLLGINIWSKNYMENIKIDENTLKEEYNKQKPKTIPSYNIYSLLVKEKNKIDDILNILEKITNDDTKFDEFKKQVKINSIDKASLKNEGNIGWINLNKLNKELQEKLKNKKINDLLLNEIPNVGWELIFIHDYKPEKELTFEESKGFLIQFLKQQELNKKIKTLVK